MISDMEDSAMVEAGENKRRVVGVSPWPMRS